MCLRGSNARVEKGLVVLKAGGVGFILANSDPVDDDVPDDDLHFLPASHITYGNGQTLYKFINESK